MPTGVSIHSVSCRYRFKATTVGVQCVKGDKVLPPPFTKRDVKHTMDKGLLLISYLWADAS